MEAIKSQDDTPFIVPDYLQQGSGALLLRLSVGFAFLGATTLLGMAAMSVISIAGRVLFSQPLPGDFELAQLLCAVSVALFLPYCHLRRAHVFVDFFTAKLSIQLRHGLDAFAGTLMTVVSAVLTWRLTVGLISMRASQETTAIVGFPIWITFIALVAGFSLLTLCAAYVALADCTAAYRHKSSVKPEQQL